MNDTKNVNTTNDDTTKAIIVKTFFLCFTKFIIDIMNRKNALVVIKRSKNNKTVVETICVTFKKKVVIHNIMNATMLILRLYQKKPFLFI